MLMVEARDAASHAKRHNNLQQTLSALEREMGRQVGNVTAKFGVPRLHAALTTRTASHAAPARFSFAAQPLPPRKSVLVPRSARTDADRRRIRRKSQAERLEAMKQRLAQEGRVAQESGSATAERSAAGARGGRRHPVDRASRRLVPRKPKPTITHRRYRSMSYEMRVARVKASVTVPAAARVGGGSAHAADAVLSAAADVGSSSARRASVLSAHRLEAVAATNATPAATPAPPTSDVDAGGAPEAQEEQWDTFVDEETGYEYAVSRLTGESVWLEADAEYGGAGYGGGGDAEVRSDIAAAAAPHRSLPSATSAVGRRGSTFVSSLLSIDEGRALAAHHRPAADSSTGPASSDIAAAAASLMSRPPLPPLPSLPSLPLATSSAGRRDSTLISGLLSIDEQLTPDVRSSVAASGSFYM